MGCHTWFANKITAITEEHVEKLRNQTAKDIRNAWIVKCSFNEWHKEIQEDIDEMENDSKELSKSDKKWLELLNKMNTNEYYEKKRKKYIKDAEILENISSPIKKVLTVLAIHNTLFDKDLENGYYDLSHLGWGDNFRVYGYPNDKFYNAQDAIKFLEDYDNGKNIVYDFKEGMCDEIRDIINKFFTEFPNGRLSYG